MRIALFVALAAIAIAAALAAGLLGGLAGQLGYAALAALLLLIPGPTNTLLALGGAAQSWRAAPPLLAAELIGYGGAIAALLGLIGIAGAARPEIAPGIASGITWALRLAAACYLACLAWRLWRTAAAARLAPGDAAAVGFRRVLIATLLNPKALVLALALPVQASGVPDWRDLATLAGLIPASGAAWIMLGAALRAGALRDAGMIGIHKAGALLLGLFALLLPLAALAG